MQTYQSELPVTTQFNDNTGHIASAICSRLQKLVDEGYWQCLNCGHVTEPIESDHGQPTVCKLCKSPRIVYHKPLHLACGVELVQPGDL